MSTWSYLTLWIGVLTFALRFVFDQGVEFVAYPSLHREKYDEMITYDGKGWSSGRHGRGPGGSKGSSGGGKWGGNRKGGKYTGMSASDLAGKAAAAIPGTGSSRRGYESKEQ